MRFGNAERVGHRLREQGIADERLHERRVRFGDDEPFCEATEDARVVGERCALFRPARGALR